MREPAQASTAVTVDASKGSNRDGTMAGSEVLNQRPKVINKNKTGKEHITLQLTSVSSSSILDWGRSTGRTRSDKPIHQLPATKRQTTALGRKDHKTINDRLVELWLRRRWFRKYGSPSSNNTKRARAQASASLLVVYAGGGSRRGWRGNSPVSCLLLLLTGLLVGDVTNKPKDEMDKKTKTRK